MGYLGDLSTASDALRALLDRTDRSVDAGFVHDLVSMAQLDQPIVVDRATAEAAVRPYLWLLDRLGTEGVALTAGGYLPPAIVEETMAVIDPAGRWIGKNNDESHTAPVLGLRESARRSGLVRKHRGRLLRTAVGTRLAHDPVALWWHVASRLPDAKADVQSDAGVMLLLAIAAGLPMTWQTEVATVHRGLLCAGWQVATRADLLDEEGWAFWHAARPTRQVLELVGATTGRDFDRAPAPPRAAASTFARAALRRPST